VEGVSPGFPPLHEGVDSRESRKGYGSPTPSGGVVWLHVNDAGFPSDLKRGGALHLKQGSPTPSGGVDCTTLICRVSLHPEEGGARHLKQGFLTPSGAWSAPR
jgi:hypothetical protein